MQTFGSFTGVVEAGTDEWRAGSGTSSTGAALVLECVKGCGAHRGVWTLGPSFIPGQAYLVSLSGLLRLSPGPPAQV